MAAAGNDFMTSLLDRSASAYANRATQLLLEEHPDIGRRYGAQAASQWRFHLAQRVNDLAAAFEFKAPALFAEAVRWSREALAARELPAQDLRASLAALRQVLADDLPQTTVMDIDTYFTPALRALDAPPAAASRLDPQRPLHRLALQYIEACLDGEMARADRMILDSLEGGLSVPDVCLDVLTPSLAEVGRLWYLGRLAIHEEHTVTANTQRLLGLLAGKTTHSPRNGKTVITATVQGNAHDIAARIISLLFEIEGWKAVCLGTELPPEELACSARDFDADLAVIPATLIAHLRALRRSINELRDASPRTRILVGGPALAIVPEVSGVLGADAVTNDARTVVGVGARLVGLS